MGKYQTRRSVSTSAEDTLLLQRIAEKLDLPQAMIVSALVKQEAKRRKVKVTFQEIEAFKDLCLPKGKRTSDKRKRASKFFPGVF